MQRSERFRRGIVVPLDREALRALQFGDVGPETRVMWYELPGDEVFYEVWSARVFADINMATGCRIDDYEDECVPADSVGKMRDVVVASLRSWRGGDEGRQFLSQLLQLSNQALRLGYPLWCIM